MVSIIDTPKSKHDVTRSLRSDVRDLSVYSASDAKATEKRVPM